MAAWKVTYFLLFITISGVYVDCALNVIFPIGGLFNHVSLDDTKKAFETITTSSGRGTMKAYDGRIISPLVRDTYSTALEVCDETSKGHGIAALIDARPTGGICDIVCLLSNRYNIPHLALGWQETASLPEDLFTFSYYPPASMISQAFSTLIRDLDWDRFSILYEDDTSFIRLQEVIASWSYQKKPITYRKLIPEGDNRETFKYIFKVARLSHHIVDCPADNLRHYMKEIVLIENSTQYQSFVLTNLDSHSVNFDGIENLNANVSTLYMTTDDPTRWLDIGINPGLGIKMETALAVDALTHLEKAIRKMLQDKEQLNEGGQATLSEYGHPPALCFRNSKAEYEPWSWGDKIRDALLQTQAKGFTGNIVFDSTGKRSNFTLHYAKINIENKFVYAGYWDSKTNIIYKEDNVKDKSQTKSGLIRVVSRKDLPYFEIEYDDEGMPHPRGYAVDLATEIFKKINNDTTTEVKYNFQLEFYEVPDGGYGKPIKGSKNWNGIVGELMAHNADLAICDLTITSDRNKVVDFSTPFMATGISILFRERDPEDPDMFSFMKPLSLDVWLYLATTYIIVSYILLICARMSQADSVNPHPCNQNPENLENIWSLYNCMWLAMGTIMTQGCDILPRGLGSRWIAGLWWFFAMIVTASYMANMSTFLSNSRRSSDIENAEALSEQNEVSYGAVYNSSTYAFFEKTNDTVFSKLFQVMSSTKPTVFTSSNIEGKNRVLNSKGNYAFFMESTAIKYYTERNCQLKMVGQPLDSKAYGIAMPKNFPHKLLVDRAILQLQEAGRLTELQTKWWNEEDNIERCDQKKKDEEEDDGSLQMKNTSGIFLVLGVGGVLGFFVAIIDFMLHANKIAAKEKVTFKEALLSEWRASLNPRALAKPTAPPRSAPASTESPSPTRERSNSRAVSVLRAATSFINFNEIY